ncbi:hypothetical protein K457DRAFT_422874 [Linnemannia elongata AG-77]|uniref:DNA recombination and repair protein Rad51-like C-terminal domain-containing protein n=1 Tax=Linnemannia elongata AG-77 TaxID=1314771 RepID=A0A197K2S6_9FUNG|nr:hypothetical protein K457DRAFT_422874 [Linnemannia elongata AG-77]
MHPTHRERLSQVSAESGLDFIAHLDDDILHSPVSVNQGLLPYHQPRQTQIHKPHNLSHNPSATPAPTAPPPQGTTKLDLDGIDQILSRYGLLRPGDILDLHGPTGSGKTHFLYAIIISTILPKFWRHSKSYPAIPLLGKARSVVFFDLDQGFDVKRVKDLLCLQIKHRVRQFLDSTNNKDRNNDVTDSNTTNSDDTSTTATSGTKEIDIESPTFLAKIDQLAISCLRNVHIFRPQDTISTIVLLRTLETYLFQQTTPTPIPSTTAAAAIPAIRIFDSRLPLDLLLARQSPNKPYPHHVPPLRRTSTPRHPLGTHLYHYQLAPRQFLLIVINWHFGFCEHR